MYLKTINGRLGKLTFLDGSLLKILKDAKVPNSDLSDVKLFHDKLSYKELAYYFKLNLEMYRILGVEGRPELPQYNNLEQPILDKLILEIEQQEVIPNMLNAVKRYSALKVVNDLVVLLETTTEDNHYANDYSKLKHDKLAPALLEAIINQYGTFETHMQNVPNKNLNEVTVPDIYRVML